MASKKQQGAQQVVESLKSTPATPENELEAHRARTARVLAEAGKVDPVTTAKKITDLSLAINSTLSSINSQVQSQFQESTVLTEAIKAKQKEMEQLYDQEMLLSSIEELAAEWERKGAELASEMETNRRRAREERDELLNDNARLKEGLRLERDREEATYQHRVGLEHQRQEEEFQAQLRQKARLETERAAQLQREWNERDAALRAREEELESLKKQVAQFPALLEKHTKEMTESAVQVVRSEMSHRAALDAASASTTNQLLAQENKALRATIEDLTTQLDKAREAVEAANEKVTDMANKSLTAAGSISALKEVQAAVASTKK